MTVRKGQTYTIERARPRSPGHRSYVYRLEVVAGPRWWPACPVVAAGTTVPVTFVGYGLKSGVAQLETLVSNVVFPKDEAGTGWYQHRLKTPTGRARRCRCGWGTLPNWWNRPPEPSGFWPGSGHHRDLVDSRRNRRVLISGQGGQMVRFEAISAEIGTWLDPVLRFIDKDDKQVATTTILAVRSTPAWISRRQPMEPTGPSPQGTGSTGRDSVYRLTARLQQPGFTLSCRRPSRRPLGAKPP
ncbi:MAG: hypothetical protein Ct9H300mP1_10440 [Planctomycetaceae bacterium]|nr:MAG: hypothetical protein Ct9H300mP1_10440 [Planctomycetaceae bacterium]